MANFYETDRAVSEYLLFHYGNATDILPWRHGPSDALEYPARCVGECLDTAGLPANARALDLGCAVGRSSFELARHCVEVLGVDCSQRFIRAANELKSRGAMDCSCAVEGGLAVHLKVEVPPGIDRSRVAFEQGDAMALRDDIGMFDVVLMANLIDRLPDPRQCIARLPGLMRAGGQLIITSPCTWLEEYTPREKWLGGYEENGRPVRTPDTLTALLEPHFQLDAVMDLPFLIREHERKFQWSVAMATVWTRRP